MINPKDIVITITERAGHDTKVQADFETHAVATVNKHEDCKELRKLAERHCRHRIWRNVYGELSDVLAELETIRLVNVSDADMRRCEELVKKTRELLAQRTKTR